MASIGHRGHDYLLADARRVGCTAYLVRRMAGVRIADWHHFVRQRLLELVAQQRPLQDEAAVLETRRQQLHAERTVLLNLMWREENFAD